MELRNLLLEYKDTTKEFIEAMEKKEYELHGEELLNKRENLLNELKTMSFDKNKLKEISKEIDLIALEDQAFKLLSDEKNKIKEEIFNLKKNRNAIKTYGVNFKNINFINKEV
ncbi:hypothetical protein [Clostridium sp. UBA7503]|uniref:hypothetical protein n=1 Tax=Clostridium sp. UBA7503 TaxID=1946377 RepID=UPI0032170CF4